MESQRESSEFKFIEYALHLATGRHEGLSVQRVLAIDNPLARHQFARRAQGQGLLILQAFAGGAELEVVSGTLGQPTGESIPIPSLRWQAGRSGGVAVEVGGVPATVLCPDAEEYSATRRKLVYCRVAVGTSMPISASEVSRLGTSKAPPPLPSGYHSFVAGEDQLQSVPNEELNNACSLGGSCVGTGLGTTDVGASGVEGWRHGWIDEPFGPDCAKCPSVRYWLQDHAQLLPIYVVEFDLSPEPGIAPAVDTPPAVHALAEDAPMTPPRAALAACGPAQQNRAAGCCEYHTEHDCAFYCAQCQRAMCAECKLSGHHSHGAAAGHPLQTLPAAHAAVVASVDEGADKPLRDRLAQIYAERQALRVR